MEIVIKLNFFSPEYCECLCSWPSSSYCPCSSTAPTTPSQGASQSLVHQGLWAVGLLGSTPAYFWHEAKLHGDSLLLAFQVPGTVPSFPAVPYQASRDHCLRARNVKFKFALILFQKQMILTWLTEFSPEFVFLFRILFFTYFLLEKKKVLFSSFHTIFGTSVGISAGCSHDTCCTVKVVWRRERI